LTGQGYNDAGRIYIKTRAMIDEYRVHNINFVTLITFNPYTFRLVEQLRENGYNLPILYNCSVISLSDFSKQQRNMRISICLITNTQTLISPNVFKVQDYPQKGLDA
jgi:hypothetical protein